MLERNRKGSQEKAHKSPSWVSSSKFISCEEQELCVGGGTMYVGHSELSSSCTTTSSITTAPLCSGNKKMRTRTDGNVFKVAPARWRL